MDHQGLNLTRRPLLPLGEGVAEPHKADGMTNRLRRIADRFASRRTSRAGYNRRQRHLYHSRVLAHGNAGQEPGDAHKKRISPLKHLGMRLRHR